MTNQETKPNINKVNLDFAQARAKHLEFKARLRSILFGLEINEEPVLSHFECGVGKWLYTHALQEYNDLPEIHELEKVHASIHVTARRLVSIYKEGREEEARQGLAEIEYIANKLVDLLTHLEKKTSGKELSQNKTSDILQENINVYSNLEKLNFELEERIKKQSLDIQLMNARFQATFKYASVGISISNTKGEFLQVNPAMESITGYSDKELQSLSILSITYPDDINENKQLLENLMKGKFPTFEIEKRFIRKDGSICWVHNNVSLIRDAEGNPFNLIAIVQEITEKKIAAEALKESKNQFEQLIENIPQITWTNHPTGEVDSYNQRWYDYTQLSYEQTKNWAWKTVVHPDDLDVVMETFLKAMETGGIYEIESRIRKGSDGSYRWHLSRAVPLRNGKGEIIRWIGTATDINDRITAEAKLKKIQESEKALLRQSEQQRQTLYNLFEQVPAMVCLTKGPEHVFEMINPACQKLFDSRNLTGKPVREALPEIKNQPIYSILDNVFKTGKPFIGKEVGVKLARTDNAPVEEIFFNFIYKATKTNTNKIDGVFIFAYEVTEQVLARKSVEENNKQLSITNADLDNFIYTASHDLKAPVSNLEGLLITFFSEIEITEEIRPLKDMMFASIDRFKSTILDLTEITKVQKGVEEEDLSSISFTDMFSEICLSIKDLMTHSGAKIESHFEVAEIKYSRKNLRSIIYNLLSNAIKYSSPDRKPHILFSTKSEPGYTVFTISDNGLGIKEENKHKVFGMFKRLHDHVEGTGLGLYIVKRIIENAGGKIRVESKLDEGSTFKIYFKS